MKANKIGGATLLYIQIKMFRIVAPSDTSVYYLEANLCTYAPALVVYDLTIEALILLTQFCQI